MKEMQNKVRSLDIFTIVAMVVSTFFYFKMALREGVAQVGYLLTGLYVLAIVISILSLVVSWKNKQYRIQS
ncbi:hypothetical protein [Lysinibacillus sp. LZ02]|uniref:hypothetical protein n=1 Tax=Lysinibacillus sp. LZ02 TaxID=3420668 RepID=UPI003D360028